ncbi:MFS transporter [Streptomyces chattanoogensis]|uniref:Alpha-ketoglutarate transporter n=1 Tax=Streptomyces chattanoogensis TaxID=66876 RepID=A0A0N0GWD1_9ACTN|nr:MFS transporter [Streptomyces chattanoogensis]KPC59720.1 alpha-ketoglutarate transporter [Streptomyces chattanoogensis]
MTNSPASPASPPSASSPSAPPPSLITRLGIPRTLVWGYLGLLLFMIGDGVESGYLSPYLTDRGFSESRVAVLFTVYGIAAGIAAWLSGVLSDLWGPRRVMWTGLGIWAAFQLLFLAAALPLASYPLMMLSYGLRGLGYPLFAYGFLVWIAAVAPRARLGTAMGWFWFAFTGGLPTLGSLVASGLIPHIGAYATLWAALVLVAAGGLIALLLVRDDRGARQDRTGSPLGTLVGSVTILWRNPRVGMGSVVRVINTASQFGFFVIMPIHFTRTVGFSLTQWLHLLSAMFATNIFANLLFGVVGDRFGWRRTIAWFGGAGCTVSTLLLFYVPNAAGANFPLALVVAAFYGATLAGYVPLSALVPSMEPRHKGQALAALNLGAGASTFVGPAVVAVFVGPLGVAGVVWIFAGMYAVSTVLALFLKLPDGPDAADGTPETGAPAAVPSAA